MAWQRCPPGTQAPAVQGAVPRASVWLHSKAAAAAALMMRVSLPSDYRNDVCPLWLDLSHLHLPY